MLPDVFFLFHWKAKLHVTLRPGLSRHFQELSTRRNDKCEKALFEKHARVVEVPVPGASAQTDSSCVVGTFRPQLPQM